MFDAHHLFKKRLSEHLKETSRYMKYIFNGHIAIAIFFLISAIAVYYQQWLAELPPDFPTEWVIGIIFGILVSMTPIRTLLQEPDLVFLIPAEHKMGIYFRNALIFSFINQLLPTLFIVAAVSPLYFHSFSERGGMIYLLTLLILLIFKGWNLLLTWWLSNIRNIRGRHIEKIARLILHCAIFYFIMKGDIVLAAIMTLLFMFLFLYVLNISRKQVGIAWEVLIEKDQNQMQLFYRIANLFTDVPHLKKRFKKRRLLVSLVSNVPFIQQYTYDYLYRITFVRSGDYLGMYVRLLIVGGLFIYFIPNEWMKIIFAFLFIYMSIFQMVTLYQHYRTNIWLDLYPVKLKVRQKAVTKWLFQLTLIQTILFAVLFFIIKLYIGFVITLVGGFLFTILFIYGYVKRSIY